MVLLRHRQRAISAISRGRWIIPKRGGSGAEPWGRMTVGNQGGGYGYHQANGFGSWEAVTGPCQQCWTFSDNFYANQDGTPTHGPTCTVKVGTQPPIEMTWNGSQGYYEVASASMHSYFQAELGNVLDVYIS